MKRILVLLSVVIGMGVLFLVPAPMALAVGSPSDPRAEFIVGNVPPGDCLVGGQPIPESKLTFSISAGQILTITAVDAGYTVQSVYASRVAKTRTCTSRGSAAFRRTRRT